ncbi:MAG: metallophosphoesterase [Armatimonadetes bacterium]|nr:metallophosphoesterase [Armatimonadota bacterium]
MPAPRTHKPRRPFNDPVADPKPFMRFEPPPPTGRNTLKLPLRVVMPEAAQAIQQAGKIVFHAVGDVGGVHGTEAQRAISDVMESQITGTVQTGQPTDTATDSPSGQGGSPPAPGADPANDPQVDPGTEVPAPGQPAFLYLLGDVIYFNGQSTLYREQFYDPYKFYPAPIFAIPGNHDGDTQVHQNDLPDTETTLTGFVMNFCDTQPRHLYPYRETMTQPYVYWTLDAPFVTLIGLYSNVEGTLDGRGNVEQQQWLTDQLKAADPAKSVIIAVHHPPYSLDNDHGGCPDIDAALDQAMADSGRMADAVFSGHVHNYQRFTRTFQGRQIPYVVAGAGGYANSSKAMHKLQTDDDGNLPPTGQPTTRADVTFEAFNQDNPGFLRLTIDDGAKTLRAEYFLVPFDDSAPSLADSFTLDLNAHTVASP